jgi:hypothetical protein
MKIKTRGANVVRLSGFEFHEYQFSECCTFLRGEYVRYVFLSNLCKTLSKGSVNSAADFVWICREGCTVLMGVNQIAYRRVP